MGREITEDRQACDSRADADHGHAVVTSDRSVPPGEAGLAVSGRLWLGRRTTSGSIAGRQHAGPQVLLGPVQQDGDMRGRQSEHRSHVFAGDLVQHPQRKDRTLQRPEVIEAPEHERKILRLSDQLVDRRRLSGEKGEGLIARIMWARDHVPAASIPRVVPHQN